MQSRKRNYIWIFPEDAAAAGPGSACSALLNGKDIDGTLGFGREFCGFELWDPRVPAHRYYCRVCGAVFASNCPSDLKIEHLRSHQKQGTQAKIDNPSGLSDQRPDMTCPNGSRGAEIPVGDIQHKIVIGGNSAGKSTRFIVNSDKPRKGRRRRITGTSSADPGKKG